MVDLLQEQILVILTTVFSLLMAWSWNSVLKQFLEEYYGRTLQVRVLSALIITIITFSLLCWILKNFNIKEEGIEKVKKANNIRHYVRNT
jgi:hypothetical protein